MVSRDIFADFAQKGIYHRSTLLLPAAAALDFVRECRSQGLDLLGFDGFRLLPGDRIQPNLAHMLDLSAAPYDKLSPTEKLNLAEQFIEELMDTDLVFEMVIG